MPEWEDVVQGMIDQFGSDARTVGVLLGFLKCLVEESGNPRIAISVCTLFLSSCSSSSWGGQKIDHGEEEKRADD
jgi:hypothetical protein